MTTAPTRPPRPSPAPQRERTPSSGAVLTPLLAGVATIAASTSLTGVIDGALWLGYLLVATALVGFTGLVLRSLRTHPILVGLAQLVVLLCLVVGAFTGSGVLAILPGPAALVELGDVLNAAFEQIRTGLPPVEGTPPILCLVTIAIGLVAMLVDTLAVTAAAPAATGLILLCVYAVPSALASDLLPWWTFAVGGAAFAALLAADGSHRHRRWRNRTTPGLGPSPASASTPVTVVAASLVVGILAGTAVTGIGTQGSLPGSSDDAQSVPGGLGVNPFTSLRGMLDQSSNVEMFRVRGLGDQPRLLRAFTLDTYRPNEGWGLRAGPMPAGVPATGRLPLATGDDGGGESQVINIQPVNWYDLWLPVFGAARALHNVSAGWFYDPGSGSIFRERRTRPAPYSEVASLREPTREELRSAVPRRTDVSPTYTNIDDVDPRVTQLARRLTAGATNDFDRAQAIWRYFSPSNGFVYDTQTAPARDPDAVADFVLNGKRGYCEQYASSMAVMLRSIGVASRVAIGFTSGYSTNGYRSITSQDAHAWVEVYFGDRGWVSFDPTPLSDGRGYVPPYLNTDEDTPDEQTPSSTEDTPQPSTSAPAPSSEAPPEQAEGRRAAADRPLTEAPPWTGWVGLVVAALAAVAVLASFGLRRRAPDDARSAAPSWLPWLAAALAALAVLLLAWWVDWTLVVAVVVLTALGLAPSLAREWVRRRRLATIDGAQPSAADAAWRELLDECADRGIDVPESATVRGAASTVAEGRGVGGRGLDGSGEADLRTVVNAVERSWYGSPDTARDGTAELGRAFEGVREGLDRAAPLSWRERLLPRSLLRRFRR